MNLGDLITALEAIPPETVVADGFANPHSYRGYYEQLAFEPVEGLTAAMMLGEARSAVGATYQGWKGGDFDMDASTTVWLACEGSTGTPITPTMIRALTPPPSDPLAPPPDLHRLLSDAVAEVLDAESFMPDPDAIVNNCMAALRLSGLLVVPS